MSEHVKGIFAKIAPSYNAMNHLLSLGFDISWNKQAVSECMLAKHEYSILDVATGTGNVAFGIESEAVKKGKRVSIIGIDISKEMLDIARARAVSKNSKVRFLEGDALQLAFPNSTFDAIASAFALRNIDNLHTFAKEAFRVLKVGGKAIFMDMALPSSRYKRLLFKAYSPIIKIEGAAIDKDAYCYLVKTINAFDKSAFLQAMAEAGFSNIRIKELALGIAFIVTGRKAY
ncbi:MAG: ubiquinone/menaquinone biosynthesis methyltransferase [Candidatus Micrarchaeaceae archaeon]